MNLHVGVPHVGSAQNHQKFKVSRKGLPNPLHVLVNDPVVAEYKSLMLWGLRSSILQEQAVSLMNDPEGSFLYNIERSSN